MCLMFRSMLVYNPSTERVGLGCAMHKQQRWSSTSSIIVHPDHVERRSIVAHGISGVVVYFRVYRPRNGLNVSGLVLA